MGITYSKKLEILQNDVEFIIQHIAPFDLDENLQFNVGVDRYIVRVTKTALVDQNGYESNYSLLDINQLAQIADSVRK